MVCFGLNSWRCPRDEQVVTAKRSVQRCLLCCQSLTLLCEALKRLARSGRTASVHELLQVRLIRDDGTYTQPHTSRPSVHHAFSNSFFALVITPSNSPPYSSASFCTSSDPSSPLPPRCFIPSLRAVRTCCLAASTVVWRFFRISERCSTVGLCKPCQSIRTPLPDNGHGALTSRRGFSGCYRLSAGVIGQVSLPDAMPTRRAS